MCFPRLEIVPRLQKKCSLEGIHKPVIDLIVRESLPFPRRRRYKSLALQQFRAEQYDSTGEGGERLIGRVACAGRPERQDLPPLLFHRGKRFDPSIRNWAEVANAERTGKTGWMKENPGGARKCRGCHALAS